MAVNPQVVAKAEEIIANIQRMAPEFTKVLPSHIPADRFVRVAITALRMNPEIAEADPRQIYGELLKCAQDGLVPDGREATIQKKNSKEGPQAKYSPMVGGICKMARNSGEISTIDALVVYENDEYASWVDEKGQHFRHVKTRGKPGDVLLTYAYALTKDGGLFFEEIFEGQMDAIKDVSAAGMKGPWGGAFADEMRRKSALRRLLKYRVPTSSDLDTVIRVDDEPEAFDKPKLPETPALPAPARTSRMAAIVDASTKAPAAPVAASTPAPATTPTPQAETPQQREPAAVDEDDQVPI